jgi:hypothetical protein
MAGKLAKRFRRQARQEAALRYDPEANAIRETARDVRSQTRGDVAAARQTARGAILGARAARPAAEKSLAEGLRMVSAGPSPAVASSSLGAAAGRDREGAQRRLAETKTALDTELTQRELDAAAGRTAAVRTARERQAGELGKLSRQLRQVAQQRGVYTSGRVGELFETKRDRDVTRRGQNITRGNNRRSTEQSERNSIRSRGLDPDTGKVIKGGPLDPDGNGKRGDQSKGKPGKASPERVEGGSAALSLARGHADRLKSSGRSRDEVLSLLISGRESQTIKNDEKGAPLPNPVKVPSVPRVREVWARAAVELAFANRVSPATRRRLKALGYDLGSLGIGKAERPVRPRSTGPNAVRPAPGSSWGTTGR